MRVADLPTPALVIDAAALETNLATMADGGLGDDLLLANETVDARRLAALAALQDRAAVTVDVGLPRCGCAPERAGALADSARSAGMVVRGVMGYEGHLMMADDRIEQRERVDAAMVRLLAAHADVGGDVVSAGGTGTFDLHHVGDGGVTEIQAGSYALMDSHYARLGHPFRQAAFVVGTIVSVSGVPVSGVPVSGISGSRRHAVADVGLKAMGVDHGNPGLDDGRGPGGAVWFLSDEHLTFAPASAVSVGDRVFVVPAHIDPTMALHDTAWLIDGDDVVERWAIDLRGW